MDECAGMRVRSVLDNSAHAGQLQVLPGLHVRACRAPTRAYLCGDRAAYRTHRAQSARACRLRPPDVWLWVTHRLCITTQPRNQALSCCVLHWAPVRTSCCLESHVAAGGLLLPSSYAYTVQVTFGPRSSSVCISFLTSVVVSFIHLSLWVDPRCEPQVADMHFSNLSDVDLQQYSVFCSVYTHHSLNVFFIP